MTLRLHRWSKRLLIPLAALPVFQAAGACDGGLITGPFFNQVTSATFGLFISSFQQVLLQNFPSADVLQILLGGNTQPFFNG